MATVVKKILITHVPDKGASATIPDGFTVVGVEGDYVYVSGPA